MALNQYPAAARSVFRANKHHRNGVPVPAFTRVYGVCYVTESVNIRLAIDQDDGPDHDG